MPHSTPNLQGPKAQNLESYNYTRMFTLLARRVNESSSSCNTWDPEGPYTGMHHGCCQARPQPLPRILPTVRPYTCKPYQTGSTLSLKLQLQQATRVYCFPSNGLRVNSAAST